MVQAHPIQILATPGRLRRGLINAAALRAAADLDDAGEIVAPAILAELGLITVALVSRANTSGSAR